ncbi:MAG: hypothetical protein K2G20_06035 [Lachnospiraceae bacterium]|nr:hypothetical protein [Lachnospiraceae bacterium]
MGTLEIILLIAGGIIFILSFFIPTGKGADAGTKEMVKKEVKNVVAREMDEVKERIEDIVDETVDYAVEKTERSLERVSNEKIMAVNEYSDTVLEDINKNHQEVMFLYDMLNDKHENIKSTVSKIEKTVKEAEAAGGQSAIKGTPAEENEEADMAEETPEESQKEDISFIDGSSEKENQNERILELHNAGKSNVEIAKELGLGVGEVKLVIDLFR